MLAPERIKPFILHADPAVRHAAVEYFADGLFPDLDLLPMVLDACTRYADLDNVRVLSEAAGLAVGDAGLDRALDRLEQAYDENFIDALNRIVFRAPVGLLSAREARLRQLANVNSAWLDDFEQRRQFARLSGDELWQRLQETAKQAADKDDESWADDSEMMDHLAEALIPHPIPDEATVCRILQQGDGIRGWLTPSLADVAGGRRYRGAIPALVAALATDQDILIDRAYLALTRIGDPEAVLLLQRGFGQADWSARLSAAVLWGRFKHPACEAAALEAIQIDAIRSDLELQTWLALSLCHLYSEPGVEVVRGLIRRGYDRSIVELEECLLALQPVMEFELPEADQWRRERERRIKTQAERRAQWEADARRHAAMREAEQKRQQFAKTAAALAPIMGRATGAAHVGRNDRCPCGSGKKFKHCCLKKRTTATPLP